VRQVSQWMTRGLGGWSSPGAGICGGGGLAPDEGSGGPITGADERLEEGWGTASACSSSRGDSVGERLTARGGAVTF
jgi:hypothetical protein